MLTNYSFRKTIPYFSRIQSLLTMVTGVYFSKHNDEDDGQLLQEDDGQLHDTEQIFEDMRQFERELQQQAQERTVTPNQRVHNLGSTDLSTSSFSSSSDLNNTSTRTKKNDRDIDSEDPEATSQKKSKINEDIVYNNETEKEEENDDKMCDNNDEAKHHIISPVSEISGSSQEIDLVKNMQTMVECLNPTPETVHAVTPSITTCCCLGLIRTKKSRQRTNNPHS